MMGAVSVWLVSTVTMTGDWARDSWPAVDALGEGRVSEYLSAKAMMGPFATLVEAPFAAFSNGTELDAYRWASLPGLLAAGMLGLYLARIAGRRGASTATQVIVGALCLVNPLTLEALDNGHPEEVLTAALAIGAVATAAEGHKGRTAVLLGLALASKQWAVIAILPALMALPAQRIRVGLVAGAIAAILTLPSILIAPDSFSEVHHNAANTGRVVTPWSVWYPFADTVVEEHHVGPEVLEAQMHEAPPLVGSLSHPLIVALAVIVPLGLALRRRGFRLTAVDAMALFALLALLRCVLDPVDNLYYHIPLLLALIGWDAFAAPGLPVRGLLGAAIAMFFMDWSHDLSNVEAFNAVYVLTATGAAIGIVWALFRRDLGTKPDFWLDEAQVSGIKGLGKRSIRGL